MKARKGMTVFTTLSAALTMLALANSNAVEAAVLSTDPGDYVALPPGTELGLLYYQHAERNRIKVDGHTVTRDFGLDSDIGIARFVHWTTLGGFTVTPQVILPFGHLDLGGGRDYSVGGAADPMVGSALWLVNDPKQERYLAIAGYVGMPLGSYDHDAPVNLGENRWKGMVHLAYVQALLPGTLYAELTLEHDTFGNNDDFFGQTLRQDDVFEVQTHLRYVFNQQNQFGVSWFHTTGGETHVGGVAQNDTTRTQRYLLTWQHFLQPTLQIQTQFGQDLDVVNGAQEKYRVNLRIAHAF